MFDKNMVKETMLIAFGSFVVALGVYYFMVPENLATGGVTGLSIVLSNYLPIPVSLTNFVLNILLLLVGFILIGKEFGGKTILSVFFLSFFMSLMEIFHPATKPVTDEILLNLICGIVISSMGLSIVFNQNASTGGTDILAKFPYEISGGQKQRTAIARALITEPSIILADEPTGSLDSRASDEVLRLFNEINNGGQTILMVTHSVKAACHAERVLFIKDGSIYHQLYKASMSNEELYQKISDTLTMIATGCGRGGRNE